MFYFEPNFIEKIPLGELFFQLLAKIEMTRTKHRLFGRHYETVQFFFYLFIHLFLLQNYDFYSAHIL